MTGSKTPPMAAGIIDLGAHSLRLEIFQLNEDRTYSGVENLSRQVNIGREVFSRGVISSDSINLICSIMKDFSLKLREYGVTYYRAVATSAVREAQNREIFLDRIKTACRIKLQVLDVTEESRLVYLAIKNNLVKNGCKFHSRNILFLTLGTGSTGVALTKQGKLIESEVFGFGSLRLYEELGDKDFVPHRFNGVIDSFASSIDRELDAQSCEHNKENHPLFVSAGAGVRLTAQLAGHELAQDSMINLSVKELDKVAEYISGKSIEELTEQLGTVDYMVKSVEPSCYMLRQMCEVTGVNKVIIPAVSTREAIIEEMIRDIFDDEDPFTGDIVSTAVALGEKYNNDTEHGMAVADTALKIFDAMNRFHRLDKRSRLMLYLSGILHDTGRFIDCRKHHKHSYYIISNSQVPGLSDREMKLVALVCRYHRKSAPRSNHSEYMSLPDEDRVLVCKLAAILRVSDGLDRTHQNKMKNAVCRVRKDVLEIKAGGSPDLSLERLFMKKRVSMLKSTFGIKVALE